MQQYDPQSHDVIIHGINFEKIVNTTGSLIETQDGQKDLGDPEGSDAIRLVKVEKIWIDHNTLADAEDGLIDAQQGSTNVTISNNWFKNHDKVMLLGSSNENKEDEKMRFTIMYNHFGPGCVQRMPRVRRGYIHIVNNVYDSWKDYAIGGEMHPQILSEGNKFIAKDKKSVRTIYDYCLLYPLE